MKIQFVGAAKKVTGSCYYLETSTKKIVVDCGLHQGKQYCEDCNLEEFPFDPAEIDVVLLTHAHLDHCGRIPRLVKHGFNGQIIATGPTLDLATLILEDSVRIMAEDAIENGIEPVFNEDDFKDTVRLMEAAEYRKPLQLDDNVQIEFFDAGHILGSSMIRIHADGKSIVFSGDLGNSPAPLLHPTERIGQADYIVMETTYGGRNHEEKRSRKLMLQSAIYETVVMGGVLMIPAFSIERTQELLYELNELVNNKDIPPVPIFVDSPLAIKATRVFQDNPEYLSNHSQDIINSGDDIFDFPGLQMTMTSEESKRINDVEAPKVIIAGSGMAVGGRILHHIKRYIGHYANQYLIVGYQVEGSLGRQLLDGAESVTVHGQEYDVNAKVTAIGGYSAHADKTKLTAWLTDFDQPSLKKVFLTHGEEDQAEQFKHHVGKSVKAEIHIPSPDEVFEL